MLNQLTASNRQDREPIRQKELPGRVGEASALSVKVSLQVFTIIEERGMAFRVTNIHQMTRSSWPRVHENICCFCCFVLFCFVLFCFVSEDLVMWESVHGSSLPPRGPSISPALWRQTGWGPSHRILGGPQWIPRLIPAPAAALFLSFPRENPRSFKGLGATLQL